jgi:hypothetical protein
MAHELSRKVSMKQVRERVKHHLKAVFGVSLMMTRLEKLKIDETSSET